MAYHSPCDDAPSFVPKLCFSPSFVTIGGFEYVKISPAKYISAQEFSELQERGRTSRPSVSPPPRTVAPVLPNDQPVQFPIEPFSEFTPKVNDFYACVNRLGQEFYDVARTFDFFQDPCASKNQGGCPLLCS